jgi:hypothetical protein
MNERAPSGGTTLATSRWEVVLADFESMLDGYIALSIAAHDNTGDTGAAIPEFTPPDDLGPLPDRLRLQATELARRAVLIEAELGRVRDEKAAQLAALNRPKAIYDHERTAGRFDTVG